MTTVMVVVVACWLAVLAYKSGKRDGSQKGYNVGRRQGRKRRR